MALQMEDLGTIHAFDERHGHGYDERDGDGVKNTALGFGVAGLAVAVVGVGAAMLYANAKGNAAKSAADYNQTQLAMLNQTLLNEVNARQLGDSQARNEYTSAASRLDDKITITNSTATSAQSAATSWANAEATLAAGVLSQQYRMCPSEVTLVSKQYCPCPASNCGCGCNG